MLRKICVILIAGILVFGINKLSFAAPRGDNAGNQRLAQAHSEHEHGTTEPDKEKISEKAVDAGNKICPVSGDKIEENTKATYEYEGKTYNFCCAGCIDEFKKDPQKYIKKIEEENK